MSHHLYAYERIPNSDRDVYEASENPHNNVDTYGRSESDYDDNYGRKEVPNHNVYKEGDDPHHDTYAANEYENGNYMRSEEPHPHDGYERNLSDPGVYEKIEESEPWTPWNNGGSRRRTTALYQNVEQFVLAGNQIPQNDNINMLDCNLVRWCLRPAMRLRPCRLWCVCDVGGFVAAAFTWFLVFAGEIMLCMFVIYPFPTPWYGMINGAFNLFCAFLGLASHWKTMFSDPVSKKPYVSLPCK